MKIIRDLFVLLMVLQATFSVNAQQNTAHPGHQPTFQNTLTSQCPDLVVDQLSIVDQTVNTIEYKYVVKNVGSTKANLDGPTNANHDNVAVQAFLSMDEVYDDNDLPAGGTILGVSPLGFLAPGATKSGQFKSNVAGNSFNYKYLILLVDWKKSLSECNERNNAKAIKITSPCPDLIVSHLVVTNKTHNSVAYKYTIKNIGTARVQLSKVAVQAYLSGDSVLNDFDVPAGGRVLSTNPGEVLDPGQIITQTFQSNTTENPFQYRMLLLKVDSLDNVRECDENNNLGRSNL